MFKYSNRFMSLKTLKMVPTGQATLKVRVGVDALTKNRRNSLPCTVMIHEGRAINA